MSTATVATFLFFFNDTATTEIYTLSLHERSSDLRDPRAPKCRALRTRRDRSHERSPRRRDPFRTSSRSLVRRSEEHTSELQSQSNLVCRLLLEKKKKELID